MRSPATTGVIILLATAATVPSAARTEPPKSEAPALFRQLVECRDIADSTARLACYDNRVAALSAAEQAKDIVVADRKEVRQARRGLFGFSIGDVGRIFGGGKDDDADAIKRIDTTVTVVARTRAGNLKLVFAEGGTWEQTDVRNFVLSPKQGQKATITKASMGSYFVSVDGQPGIKMRRVE